jgi:hypothetical protein
MNIGGRWGSGICGILLAQTASAASAPPGAQPEKPAATPRAAAPQEHWYGWQILVSDLSSLLVGGVTQAPIGALGYLVAPPMIHVFHGQGMLALASVGLRIGLPLAGAAVAIGGTHSCSSDDGIGPCGVGWIAVGILVGLSGMGLDTAFAYEPVQHPEPVGLRLLPQLLLSDRELRLGLAGSF